MSNMAGVRAFRYAPIWLSVTALLVLILFLDSAHVSTRVPHSQWIANAIQIAYFVFMYRSAPPRLRGLMKYGVVVATIGEVVFSLFVGMYEYRLANVPVYVPPGHSIVYGAVYYFVREPAVLRNRGWVAPLMLVMGVGYAAYWLVARNDVYGAVCTGLFLLLIWREQSSRLFFLAMFLLVAYLEQLGTRFSCWYWHPTLLGRFDWMPSGNPPSGISVFYFGFDLGCLLAYLKRRPELRARYERLKEHREARQIS
ncbi:MAG TPA: hypothetical protein VM925_06285 [Labilithrix sp.]|nr:hypothetical protein [Labilithrix sp.]